MCSAGSKSRPKTVSEFFNTHLTEKPLFLCDMSLTHDLRGVWIEPAAGNGKREHEIIKTCVRVIATGVGDINLAPVITPDLSKKIVECIMLVMTLTTSPTESTPFSHWCKIALSLELRSSVLATSHWLATATL